MKEMKLSEFCKEFGQEKAAEILNCTQGNISQILIAKKRSIFIKENPEGAETKYSCYEVKQLSKPA